MHRYVILIAYCFGLLVGFASFVVRFQQYTNPDVFRALDGAKMRTTLGWLITNRPLAEVRSFLDVVYPAQEPISHGVGHLYGEEVYRRYGSKAFGLCDPLFNYGCYHGVVDMAIRIAGPNETLVFDLKKSCDDTLADASPCIHPLGHASAIVTSYDVVKAFELCDQMYPDTKVAFSCWNGAMMEYINRSAPNAPRTDYGNTQNPYFPCNTFPSKYESSCVSMHISYLKAIWNEDFGRVLRYCQTFDRFDTRTHCVDATGSIIGQKYFTDPAQAVAVCKGAGNDFAWCAFGVNVPYLAAHKLHDARIVCDALTLLADKELCQIKIARVSDQLN